MYRVPRLRPHCRRRAPSCLFCAPVTSHSLHPFASSPPPPPRPLPPSPRVVHNTRPATLHTYTRTCSLTSHLTHARRPHTRIPTPHITGTQLERDRFVLSMGGAGWEQGGDHRGRSGETRERREKETNKETDISFFVVVSPPPRVRARASPVAPPGCPPRLPVSPRMILLAASSVAIAAHVVRPCTLRRVLCLMVWGVWCGV